MAELSAIVGRIAGQLGATAGPPVALQGGITNRNYRIRFGERDCVLRLPGKDTELLGISRDAERIATEQAARLGIAPALVAAGDDYMVSEYINAAPIDGERLRGAPESAARALRAFHDSGLRLPTRFWVPELLADYEQIVRRRGRGPDPGLPDSYEASYGHATELARRIAAALPLNAPVPCHNDLLPGNILARPAAPEQAVLVDWEYAGMGHRMFDLGNLAVNNEFDEPAEVRLLQAYYDREPPSGARAALKLMRIMSDVREAAWGVVQDAISELEFDFAGYAGQHFRRLADAARDPRMEQWLRGATA